MTLSKALGSQGGAVLGTPEVRAHLIDTARIFIFDTALAPGSVGAALAALELVDAARVASLRDATADLARLLEIPTPDNAVLSIVVGDPISAVSARDLCAAAGVRVGCFRPPSVPPGASCLRIAARADLTAAQTRRAAGWIRTATTDPS